LEDSKKVLDNSFVKCYINNIGETMKSIRLIIAGFLLGFVISYTGSLFYEAPTHYVDKEIMEDKQLDAALTLELPESNNE
jgi:hypothetical protein